jgi:hypothetical protein
MKNGDRFTGEIKRLGAGVLSVSLSYATISIPTSKHQSLKFSYSNGTCIRFGGNYQNVSVAWQYSWLGRRY